MQPYQHKVETVPLRKIGEKADEMGKNGWELAAAIPDQEKLGEVCLVFKRNTVEGGFSSPAVGG